MMQCPTSVLITPLAIPESVRIASVSNASKPDLLRDLSGPAETQIRLQHSQLLQPLQPYLSRPQPLPESMMQCPTSVLITPLAIPESVRIASVSNAFKPDLVRDLSGPAERQIYMVSEEVASSVSPALSIFPSQ
jgi:hypothetical protein